MFGELLKTSAHEGKEKHVPVIHAPATAVPGEFFPVSIAVGEEIAHPNSAEHHIKWLQVYVKSEGSNPVHVGFFDFAPGFVEPKVTFDLKLDKPAVIYALAYCNIHGIWESNAAIGV